MPSKIYKLLEKLKKDEEYFLKNNFIAPSVKNRPIQVKISNIIMSLRVTPAFEGWGIFTCSGLKTARFIRNPSMSERREYLDLFPKFNCTIYKQDKPVKGILSNARYKNIILDGEITVQLPEEISIFDEVVVRWDGENFWYDEASPTSNFKIIESARTALAGKINIDSFKNQVTGLNPAQLKAYRLAFENVRDKTKDKIEDALKRSGAKLTSYIDRGDTYTVKYVVPTSNGEREITSTINSKDLQVQVAGICLSGGDRNFDLQSLVHVIKEGERLDRIVVGDYHNYGYNG